MSSAFLQSILKMLGPNFPFPPFHGGRGQGKGDHDATNSVPPFHSGKGVRGIGRNHFSTLFPFPISGEGVRG